VNQESDLEIERTKNNLERGKSLRFITHEDGTLQFQNDLYVPKKSKIKEEDLRGRSQHLIPYASRRHQDVQRPKAILLEE